MLLTEGSGATHRHAMPGTANDLAMDLGLTHEALYRTLASMEREGLILRDAGTLFLAERRRPLGLVGAVTFPSQGNCTFPP